jgi:hypothetical protein
MCKYIRETEIEELSEEAQPVKVKISRKSKIKVNDKASFFGKKKSRREWRTSR